MARITSGLHSRWPRTPNLQEFGAPADHSPVVLALIPFLAFAIAFGAGAVFLFVFLRGARTTVQGDAVHIESRLGTFDLKPNQQADPELAALLQYPGALHCNAAAAEYKIDVAFGKREFHSVNTSFWTPDPVSRVCEYYRRELPQWVEDSDDAAYALSDHSTGSERKIRVFRKGDRTMIETSVSTNAGSGVRP